MKKLMIIAALALAGCGPDPTQGMDTPLSSDGRFEIKRVAVVDDGLAYGDRRGIYVLTDTQTGTEYVGVSGVGISEVGSHQSGKARMTDER